MKVYILKRDYEHLCDMEYDISLISFAGSEDLKYQLLSDKKIVFSKPVEFLANFSVVKSESDCPIVSQDVDVMSHKMVDVLKGVGHFNCNLYDAVLVDDTFLKNRYDSSGNLNPEVPVLKNFYIIQLLELLKVFDFENSEFKTLRSNPGYPGIVKKLILKEPKEGFPPIFRMFERPSATFLSQEAKAALEENNIKGCIYEPVDVTPYREK